MNPGSMYRPIASTLLLLTAGLSAAESRLELRHREKNGVGYDQGYTTVEYLMAHSFSKPEILFNLRGHLFDDGRFASNVGLGVRYPFSEESCLLGVNAFYDFRESKHILAHQVGAGLELLFKKVDFRANGYLPVGDRFYEKSRFDHFEGNAIIIRQKGIAALPSAEFEVGLPLSRRFYLAFAPYYLFAEKTHRISFGNAFGGKTRFSIDLGRYCSLGAAATYDSIFRWTVQGMISLRIPFGKFSKEKPKNRILRDIPIYRNEIIPLEKKSRKQALSRSGDEERDGLEIVFVNNSFEGEGNGTFEAPFASLAEAEENSNPGDVIYVFPGDGTARNMDEGISLQEGQVLAGSGSPLTIEGVEIPAQTPGETPVITNIHPDEPVVANPGDSDLSSFMIVEPWEYLLESWSYDFGFDAGAPPDAAVDALPIDNDGGGAAGDNGGFIDAVDIDGGWVDGADMGGLEAALDLGGNGDGGFVDLGGSGDNGGAGIDNIGTVETVDNGTVDVDADFGIDNIGNTETVDNGANAAETNTGTGADNDGWEVVSNPDGEFSLNFDDNYF